MTTTHTAKVERVAVRSRLAGTWYEGNAERLRKEINGYLAAEPGGGVERLCAMILPHAGYQYSGAVAAAGAKQAGGRTFSRVIVMGPSHHVYLPNAASVPRATHYLTPLGEIPVDTEAVRILLGLEGITSVESAHGPEHSVEIEFPILQAVLGDFAVVPVVVGQLDDAAVGTVARALLSVVDAQTLVVTSSDFCHYGPNYGFVPFTNRVEEHLKGLDLGAYAQIEKLSVKGFRSYCGKTGATICGKDPISVLLEMLPRESSARLIRYDTSGRMVGDFGNSVSYLAIAFSGQWPQPKAGARAKGAGDSTPLTEDEQEALLALARQTLERHFAKGARRLTAEEAGVTLTQGLMKPMGAFVTLKKGGHLRGCIGEIFAQRPLYEAVMQRAVDSAVRDTRFPPVKGDELTALSIEISALTPPKPVGSYREIEVGRHGVVLSKEGASAVFLPQVAPEQGWDLAQMLTHLSMKAGLPPDAWQEDASFMVFEAQVFGEGE